MKLRNRQGPLVTLLLSITASIITSLIIIFVKDESIQERWIEIFVSVAIVLLIFMVVMLYYISELKFLSQKNFNSVEDIVKKNLDGFRIISAEQMLHIAKNEIKRCNSIKVIGIARQHSKPNTPEFKLMKEYLSQTEKRVNQKSNSSNKLNYKRITQRKNTPEFKDHLYKIMELGQSKGHEVSIVLFDDYQIAYTYTVIDNKLVILQVQNISLGHTTLDAKLNLISYNPDIISIYTEHFDRIWSNSLIISNKDKLEFEFDKVSKLIDKLNVSRKYLSSIGYNSSAYFHGKLEIEQVYSRLKGLSRGLLTVQHKVANGKLLSILSNYIGQLKSNESYLTISFYEFWQEIEYPSENKFIENNIKALKNGANLFRLFAVNKEFIKNNNLFPQHKKILEKKMNLIHNLIETSNAVKGNFRISLLFLEEKEYRNKLNSYYQSSLFLKDQEIILFDPANRDKDSKIYEGSTIIQYIDRTPEHNNINEVESNIEKTDFEISFNQYWTSSVINLKEVLTNRSSNEFDFIKSHSLESALKLTIDDDGIIPSS